MTLEELKEQALQLSSADRWQLTQALLDSLKQDTQPKLKPGNLSRLRGIARAAFDNADQESYVEYLIKKYQ